MDDGRKQKINESKIIRTHINNNSNDGNVLPSIWLRRNSLLPNEVDKFLTNYGRNFILPVGIILWVALIIEILFK